MNIPAVHSIRSHIILLLLLIVGAVPVIGYLSVQSVKDSLQTSQQVALRASACTAANFLNENPDLFDFKVLDSLANDLLFSDVPWFDTPIHLDGELDDWEPYLQQLQTYAGNHVIGPHQADYDPESLSFRFTMGRHRGYLFALFLVRDDSVVAYQDGSPIDRNDHLQVILQAPNPQHYQRFVATLSNTQALQSFSTTLGSLDAPESSPLVALELDALIVSGFWRPMPGGYSVELRIPLNAIGNHLGFIVSDVDFPDTATVRNRIGTFGFREHSKNVWNFITPPKDINQTLGLINSSSPRHIWVVDQQARLLGEKHPDPLESKEAAEGRTGWLHALMSPLLPSLDPAVFQLSAEQSRPRPYAQEVREALRGVEQFNTRSLGGEAELLTATCPIKSDTEVIGAVVMEETNQRSLEVQHQIIEQVVLFNFSATLLIVSLLGGYVIRLFRRLHRLETEADNAIGYDGQVMPERISAGSQDEIGKLARSFANILSRVREYNQYLQSMASKLSHELRTPLAVVRSSLENLELEAVSDEQRVYLERAKQGGERLSTIFTRLSEATRLEQALQSTEYELFELVPLVRACVEGYRLAYPQREFNVSLPADHLRLRGSPDLLAQMLDKLVANAEDFATPGTPVQVEVVRQGHLAVLRVANQGKALPPVMRERLFESMVSVRDQTPAEDRKNLHLGLGLYIVRLIAAFHGGSVRASDYPQAEGAVFSVFLPLHTGGGGVPGPTR